MFTLHTQTPDTPVLRMSELSDTMSNLSLEPLNRRVPQLFANDEDDNNDDDNNDDEAETLQLVVHPPTVRPRRKLEDNVQYTTPVGPIRALIQYIGEYMLDIYNGKYKKLVNSNQSNLPFFKDLGNFQFLILHVEVVRSEENFAIVFSIFP